MFALRNLTESIIWVGTNDRRLQLFENMFPIPKGVSYNSYVIMDEKTALMDTVDDATRTPYIENVKKALNGRTLDYLVINHMEPDHCGTIPDIIALYPNVKIVGNKKTFEFMEAFYAIGAQNNYYEISEGSIIELGKHKLTFYSMPMVHWPEVMVAYEHTTKTLFSADAFGTFGALNGNIFDDEVDFEGYYEAEARRYYSNIVGKYGMQVTNALKKLGTLDIAQIAPLHGPVWRKNLGYILEKYTKWSSYTPEKKGVVIAFTSMYGNTENAAQIIANKLAEKSITDIKMFDASKTDASYIVAEIWKYSHVVFAAPTYNAGLYPIMKSLFSKLEAVAFQNRSVTLIGNYSWQGAALPAMEKAMSEFKNITVTGKIDIKSSPTLENEIQLTQMADDIVKSL